MISFYAQSRGLLPHQIRWLVCHIGCCQKKGAWFNSIMIRSLIPATTVPGLVLIKPICYLGMKDLAMNTKVLLLKWILLVFNVIDDLTPLHLLYGVILNYVIVDDLRPLVCQLLCYLTRQEDVKLYRAQKLLQIRQRVGDEVPLTALLVIYQLHAPHLIPITLKSQQKKWFNNFEKTLSANIAKVQKLRCSDISTPSFINARNYATLAPPSVILCMLPFHEELCQYVVLQSLVELLRHFAVIEWPRFYRYLQQEDQSTEMSHSVFILEYSDDIDPKNMIAGFISYVDELLIYCLQVTKLPCDYNITVFILPTAEFHFCSLFSLNGMAIAMACNHILQFDKCLDVAKRLSLRDRRVVEQFNSIVVDFCNALWRCLIFVERQSEYETLGFQFTSEYLAITCKIDDPSERLHITQHIALLGYVISFLAKIQKGNKQIHPASITHQGEMTQAYFNYLELNHMDGIVKFIKKFIKRE